MGKTLGIDLGTNSIGLTLRENDVFSWYGVYTFRKGVGEGKSGEFSFAAERTKHRSSRRLYNSRRYRKWETLKVLIENGFCPLRIESLNEWKYYKKGIGRVFPINDIAFEKWIKLDFDGDGSPDYSSPYQLRRKLITERLDLVKEENRYKIGRALYHIAQRRGFKSSRKSGDKEESSMYKGSAETKTMGYNDYKGLVEEHGSLGAAFAYLEDNDVRVRNRYTLRSDYQKEVHEILKFQNIHDGEFSEKIDKAIFYQRPLRSQKGLIGKCTLEPNKHRCPVSHPKFEEYRAWSFINNIRYRTLANDPFQPLPQGVKEDVFHDAFFFKSKRELKFSDIRKAIEKFGSQDWELNYSHRMDEISVPSCYVSARLKAALGTEWQSFERTVERKNKRGDVKIVKYNIDDLWHILFSFEDEDYFVEFIKNNLELEETQTKELLNLFRTLPVGYANLSLKAINNILPFLRKGMIYTEAVILAKLPEILGAEFDKNKDVIIEALENEIVENRYQKTVTSIVNNLIFKYHALDSDIKFGWKDTSYRLDNSDRKEIVTAAIEHYGDKSWNRLPDDFKNELLNNVAVKYQEFFQSSKREHFRHPHLVNQVKEFLLNHFDVSASALETIYHPSQINIYPSKEEQIYLESPKTAAFKNPMAYKTLYRLRDVINYLIETGKIDSDTRIVVEVARELNDANKRWAIEKYQRDREVENRAFSAAIEELSNEPNFSGLANAQKDTDIDKFRIWTEQLERFDEVRTEINTIENNRKLSTTDKDVMKYRLWREQNCFCMYTGLPIRLTDLFDENKVDFEHTIPRSKSFDNSLANLTVCYADYNRKVKKNRLPVDLPNYDKSNGYSPIRPRLAAWEQKVESLFEQIQFWKNKSKQAMDKAEKDHAIRQRHIRQMEHDYWKNKVDRFTRSELPKGFINSQLVDTQIITKYATHYLKTVFNRVDVIKGSVTSDFRRIYGIQPQGEVKSRDKHSHHAVDAAVLTLIPSVRKREETLKKAYEFAEKYNNKKQYHESPFPGFRHSMIKEIEDNILINNIADKDQTLTPSIKKVRRRGTIVWLRDNNGNYLLDDNGHKIPKIAQGDSVRGELHQQTYYGKIKIAAKNKNGGLKRDEHGNIVYNQVDGKDEVWMVLRKPIEDVNFKTDVIVDPHLAEHLKKQLTNGTKQNELKDFRGKVLRRLRCRVKAARGYMNPDNATVVKEQTYKSSKVYKNFIYADSGENYMFGLYENVNGRSIVPFNVFESARYAKAIDEVSPESLFQAKELVSPVYIGRGRKAKKAQLTHVFMVGQKVLLFENDKDELKDMTTKELAKRLYFVKRLADARSQRILFQHHLEARDDNELLKSFPKDQFGTKGKDGFSSYSADFIAPRLLLTPGNFNFIIEVKDFKINLDGSIEFKY